MFRRALTLPSTQRFLASQAQCLLNYRISAASVPHISPAPDVNVQTTALHSLSGIVAEPTAESKCTYRNNVVESHTFVLGHQFLAYHHHGSCS